MIVGTPERIASKGEIPKGSDTEGITYTSLYWNIRCTSLPRKNPVKWKRVPKPNWATRRTKGFIFSPLPAITKRTLGTRFITLAAASTKYSGPFCKVMRPKKVTILSLMPRSSLCWSSVLKSTALCTVTTFSAGMPYFSITMLRVQLLTVTTTSAASIPRFSMSYTSVLRLYSPPRSYSVACTCTIRGLPEIFLATMPALYVSQS